MSEAARRATRNKAYAMGYEAGQAGRELVNPFKAGSGSRSDFFYVMGYDHGKSGAPRQFEKDPIIKALDAGAVHFTGHAAVERQEPEREAPGQPVGSDQ